MSRARPGHTVRSLYLRTQAELGEFADRLQLAVFDGDGFAENESLVLRARMPYITLMRGASVIYLLTYGTRGESTRRRISVAGLGVASILASRAEIKSLAKSARRHALPRLIRDVTETTATSFMASAYTSASVSGAPLATELGFRMGPPATLLLVPHLLGAAVGRKASRQPMTFDQLVYLAIGLAGGVGIRHVEAQRVRQHRRVVDESRSAARLAGEAAGRRSVAFHKLATHDADLPGDTPHECIGNSRIALNEPTREGPLRQMLTNRRAQLWEE
ncbi:MAG: hypothetical protein JWN99_2748, partial [Ilumatobacteraceae bacterium]|nr:hypothetical protein [Ilumatobacteraceae bacterium]